VESAHPEFPVGTGGKHHVTSFVTAMVYMVMPSFGLRAMGIRDRPISVRSECLDSVVVFGEQHLRHLLSFYKQDYNGARTHLSLEKDAPLTRDAQRGWHLDNGLLVVDNGCALGTIASQRLIG
jgi:hypothetical protein